MAGSGGGGGPSAGSVISAVGNIVAGFGAFQSSRARASALRGAARQARRDASMEAQLATDEGERAAASAAVMGAASGGGFEGSFDTVLQNLEQTARFNSRSAIWAGNVEAANREYEAAVAKQEGKFALLSSVLQATSSVAGSSMSRAEQSKQKDYRGSYYAKGGR